jgi:hypothetical protein
MVQYDRKFQLARELFNLESGVMQLNEQILTTAKMIKYTPATVVLPELQNKFDVQSLNPFG